MTEGLTQASGATIVVRRLTRTLVGPDGRECVLPVLSLRLLDTLAAHTPRFVPAEELLQRVWPETHISAGALKQRVRQVRTALEEVGYDPRLIDSARGEGYALLATLVEEASDEPAPRIGPPSAGVGGQASGRRLLVGALTVTVLALATFALLRRGAEAVRRPVLTATPLRVAYNAGLSAAVGGSRVLREVARLPDVLLVSDPDSTACADPGRAHLCVAMARTGNPAREIVMLRQVESGAVLLRSDAVGVQGPDDAAFSLQVAQYASPGAMRWLGGRTGAGDQQFSAYREGVRLLGVCDGDRRLGAESRRVHNAAERAPRFAALRALDVLLRVEDARAREDRTVLDQLAAEAQALLLESGDQLALAHVAVARALAADAPQTARSAERAVQLQPILAAFLGPDGVPHLVGPPRCG